MFLDTNQGCLNEEAIILIEAMQTKGLQSWHSVHFRYGDIIKIARANANDVEVFLDLTNDTDRP